MKIRVTLLTENDKHVDLPKEELEKKAKQGWQIIASIIPSLSDDSSEKATVEKVEVVEQ